MINYREELFKMVSESHAKAWLKENPRPDSWNGDVWSWAFWNMPKVKIKYDVNLVPLRELIR